MPAREFLPAALEIMETPASPIGRAISFCIIAFFYVALTWAYFGHVDIIEYLLAPLLKCKFEFEIFVQVQNNNSFGLRSILGAEDYELLKFEWGCIL